MQVEELAKRLNISVYELFCRAHRAYGFAVRTSVHGDFQRFKAAVLIPEYVAKFCAAQTQKFVPEEGLSNFAEWERKYLPRPALKDLTPQAP